MKMFNRREHSSRIPDNAIAPSYATVHPIRMKAPGTCGELAQGEIDGCDFLVNCPINLFSHATIEQAIALGVDVRDAAHHTKICNAVALYAQEQGLSLAHKISIESAIPRGKGMASSTADITAALSAVCRSCDRSLPPEAFASLIAMVEPSDCVHFPGVAHVNHLTGELLGIWQAPQNLRIIVVDCGGEVDTISFDREYARHVYRKNQPIVYGFLERLRHSLQDGDIAAIGEAATESAELSQQIHPKPQFDDLRSLTQGLGALGVNCAHSGTVLGVLYQASNDLRDTLLRGIEQQFGSDLAVLGDFTLIGGGCSEA
jgi:L-threonine kinase